MPSLGEMKASSPAYAAMSDDEFAQRVYEKHYADKMSMEDFRAKVSAPAQAKPQPVQAPQMLSREPARAMSYTPGMGAIQSGAPAYDAQAEQEAAAASKLADFQSLPAPVRAAVGVGSSVANMGRGVGQLASAGMDAVMPQQPNVSSLISGRSNSRYASAMEDEQRIRQQDSYMEGDTAASVGKVSGDLAMMAVPASKVGALPKLGQYAASAGLGAGYGALQPVAEGESRTANAAWGGGLGFAGQAASHGLSALGARSKTAIDPLKRELAKVAEKYNIPLHASQISNSMPAKVMASAGKYLPFSGAGKAAERQQGAFNAALGKTMGVDGATKLSDDVIRGAKKQIGKTYDDIFDRNEVALDKTAIEELAALKEKVARSLDKDNADVVRKNVDYLIDNLGANGKIPGKVYQSLRGELAGSGDKVGVFLKDIRATLDRAAGRSVGPEDAAALKTANSQWANARTIQDALKQAGGAAENVNPANLWNLVKKGSTKELRELARLGQVVLKDPIPDSGTAQRSLLYTMLAGGAATGALPLMVKSAAAGATLGRVANSPRLAQLMLREGRGKGAQALAPYARSASGLAPFVAQKKSDDSRKRP